MRRATDSHRPPVSQPTVEPRKRRLNLSCLFPLYVCIALGWLASVRLRPGEGPHRRPATLERAREPRAACRPWTNCQKPNAARIKGRGTWSLHLLIHRFGLLRDDKGTLVHSYKAALGA